MPTRWNEPRTWMTRFGVSLLLLAALGVARVEAQAIKDFARVEGVRPIPIKGFGLVTGLAGTGDSTRSELTKSVYRSYLESAGFDVDTIDLKSKNIAVVMVTASVASWTKPGSGIPVQISSLGDAKSLRGGQLQQTYLYGTPRHSEDDVLKRPLAYAQGAIEITGETETVGSGTATLEADLSFPIKDAQDAFRIILNEPDFSTAATVARAINDNPLLRVLSGGRPIDAWADDLGSIVVPIPENHRDSRRFVQFISKVMTDVPVEELDPEARVVIDKESGGVSINGRVRVTPVVVIYKGLEIRIGAPGAAGGGARPGAQLLVDVMWGLEQSGLETGDMPQIIRLIHDSGALTGKLVER